MRRMIPILGIFLITILIIISGSSVAVWKYIDHVDGYYQCTNPTWAVGSPDGQDATIGVSTPREKLGWIVLDLGEGNEMGPSQNFTVFHSTAENETYTLTIWTVNNDTWHVYPLDYWDTENLVFQTPPTSGKSWRYVQFDALDGSTGPQDWIYGPEVDAVGWE